MFTNIRKYIAIKSPDKQGILEGRRDMLKEGKVPFVPPFKNKKKEWILIIVEYKNSELWVKN